MDKKVENKKVDKKMDKKVKKVDVDTEIGDLNLFTPRGDPFFCEITQKLPIGAQDDRRRQATLRIGLCKDGKEVVLKWPFRDESSENYHERRKHRVEREIKFMKELQSQGLPISNLLASGTIIIDGEPRPCFAARYYSKGSVAVGMEDKSFQMDPAILMLTLTQMLVQFHKAGYIHRDIKPANIFRDDDDSLLFGDLGFAYKMSAPLEEPELSDDRAIIGTPSNTMFFDSTYLSEYNKGAPPGIERSPEKDLHQLRNTLEEIVAYIHTLDPHDEKTKSDRITKIGQIATKKTAEEVLQFLLKRDESVLAQDDSVIPAVAPLSQQPPKKRKSCCEVL